MNPDLRYQLPPIYSQILLPVSGSSHMPPLCDQGRVEKLAFASTFSLQSNFNLYYHFYSWSHEKYISCGYFSQMRSLFASRNIASLQQLNGGDILLDVCVELVYLKRYLAYYQDCVRGGDYVMPTSMSEAMSTRTR